MPPPVWRERSMSPNTARALSEVDTLEVLRWAADVAAGGDVQLPPTPSAPSREAWLALDVAQVRPELDRLLLGKNTQEGLDALLHTGFLDAWLPEVRAMVVRMVLPRGENDDDDDDGGGDDGNWCRGRW